MNTRLTMLAALAASLLFSNIQQVAAQANAQPNATATGPAKTPPDQTSMPNASPPATTTQTTGQTNQDPTVKEMNAKKKTRSSGKANSESARHCRSAYRTRYFAYRPLNFGGRFSLKASTPSRRSSVGTMRL
jgi:hypothetical protein